ncbi:MAG: D-tyrosyl-tRNA(Tyr) deacylase [Bacillota bacterium]|nr:MAG: D-tyrosyl-tRNA(Tyr) deacylase [Bacillota bacterium]
MRVLVQKCRNASVSVSGKIVGRCDFGLMLLVGFTEGDDSSNISYLVNKVLKLRIFEDENGVMNRSVMDVDGSILSVSQFTLYGDTSKGNRPSYIKALNGERAKELYDSFNQELSKSISVQTGEFGADMEVSFTNLGPTTILLER